MPHPGFFPDTGRTCHFYLCWNIWRLCFLLLPDLLLVHKVMQYYLQWIQFSQFSAATNNWILQCNKYRIAVLSEHEPVTICCVNYLYICVFPGAEVIYNSVTFNSHIYIALILNGANKSFIKTQLHRGITITDSLNHVRIWNLVI